LQVNMEARHAGLWRRAQALCAEALVRKKTSGSTTARLLGFRRRS
jgi:hypothetical protein